MQSLLAKAVALILFGQVFVACDVNQNDIVAETGLEGTVLRGPMCPVQSDQDPCPDQPFRALFHVFDEKGVEVATFESDAMGHFRVVLAPGTYTIVADETAPLLPKRQSKQVKVGSLGFTTTTLVFDTGIR
ncbi:MAG: hypothetical protein D6743_12060 [Calditrichaeota bacterium]|nr:MAG: hypothetical protein D6743_12060 [Calditrichota bacterium]